MKIPIGTLRSSPHKTILLICLFFITIFKIDSGFAQQSTQESKLKTGEIHKHVFELKTGKEIILLTLGAGLNIYNMYLHNQVMPLTPSEIAQLDPNQINSFDRKTIDNYREEGAGDYLLYASILIPFTVPLTIFKGEEHKSDWKVWAIMTSELLLLNGGFNGIIKSSALRTRPFVYNPDVSLELKTEKKARFSFYSGHTSTTASLTFFTARLFAGYLTDTKTKTLIWIGAVTYPALTGYLRLETGRHFRTDVITGYILGAFFGYIIPDLHRITNDRLSFRPSFGEGSYHFYLSYTL
jgi:membrane-associated phospholipid phosphatase